MHPQTAELRYEETRLSALRNRNATKAEISGESETIIQARTQAEVLQKIEHNKALGILQLRDMVSADNVRRYEEEQRVNDMRLQASQETVGNMAQTFGMLSQLHTSHARKYFSIYKTAAIGDTIISTSRAAMKAYAEYGPTFGSAAAASIVALGAAKVALIRAQSFDGGSGAAGAAGTFSANPSTGLPDSRSGSGGMGTIIINLNGQRVGEYELTSKVARTLYNNNGSVDGYSISVERSA